MSYLILTTLTKCRSADMVPSMRTKIRRGDVVQVKTSYNSMVRMRALGPPEPGSPSLVRVCSEEAFHSKDPDAMALPWPAAFILREGAVPPGKVRPNDE